jgi:hypothetical protein
MTTGVMDRVRVSALHYMGNIILNLLILASAIVLLMSSVLLFAP